MVEALDAAPPLVDQFSGGGQGEDPVYFCDDCPFRGAASSRLVDIAGTKFRLGTGIEAAGIFVDDDKNTSEVFDIPPRNTPESLDHKNPAREFDSQQCFDAVRQCGEPTVRKTAILRREVRECPALYSFVPKRTARKLKREVQSRKWSK